MSTQLHLNAGWIASSIVVSLFAIAYPIILALVARRRLGVGWKYFGFGALIFFLFQLITRVPAVTVLGVVLAPQLKASHAALYTWLAVLAVTAGLFEEVGRYVGYRWLMRREEKTWNKAIMYGLGHGGLESIVLIGAGGLLTVVNLVAIAAIGLGKLPAAQQGAVAHQFAAINAQPAWLPLLSAWERLWTIPVHVALSVLVLQVFRRGKLGWLWLAIVAHAIVDGTSVFAVQLLGPGKMSTTLIVEGMIGIFGLVALWITFALRDRPAADADAAEQAPAGAQPDTLAEPQEQR